MDTKELRELRKWLQSPMHNQRDDVRDLYDFLMENQNYKNDESIDKTIVWKHLFPKTSFDDDRMRQVIFFAQQASEQFLIYKEQQRDEVQTQRSLSAVYRRKGLHKLYERSSKISRQIQDNQVYRHSVFLRNDYLLELEHYTYLSRQTRTKNINLQEAARSLDAAYLAEKLRLCCLMLSHQGVLQQHYDLGILPEVIRYAEQSDWLNIPAIAVYYYSYKALTERDVTSHFQTLKNQLENHGHSFPKAEQSDLFLLAINYCIGRINAGDTSYYQESYNLYRKGFENEVFIQNEEISRWTFQNTVMAALRVKEFDWVEMFIKKYQIYLADVHRETFVSYCLSRLFYERKDYSKAMQLLRQHEYNDVLINLNAKLLLLKMLYELDEVEVLSALLESMRTYLQRKDINEQHKANYKNIIRFTKKMLNLGPYSDTKRAKVKAEIIAATPMSEKDWFLRQL